MPKEEPEIFARKRQEGEKRHVSPLRSGLLCRCPRCGIGALYDGFLTVAPRCRHCALDYSAVDSGDGPAIFIILIVGFLVTFAALAVETAFAPPYWVHAVLWIPAILILSLVLLRPFKAILIALQFHHGAREGRRHED
ncbi:MAG: DUF983 domain-containing protein [Rhodothalassiaceae bacterium]